MQFAKKLMVVRNKFLQCNSALWVEICKRRLWRGASLSIWAPSGEYGGELLYWGLRKVSLFLLGDLVHYGSERYVNEGPGNGHLSPSGNQEGRLFSQGF
jgi:hypothetical protein